MPRSLADAVAGVDRAGALGAQVSHPLDATATGRLGQHLAVRVSARQPAVVAAVAFGNARDKEAHRGRWCLRLLRKSQIRTECDRKRQGAKDGSDVMHGLSSPRKSYLTRDRRAKRK